VIALRPNEMALVEMDNSQQEVALDLIENVQVGDRLLVHVGVAIARLEG
jgi:hydrogenase assembly chaperone HypC/HupF